MKPNFSKLFGPIRSPTPILYKESQLFRAKSRHSYLQKLKTHSGSYKKLQKLYINDTCLAFVHKMKELKGRQTKINIINAPNEKIIESFSNPILTPLPIYDNSYRGSPINLVRGTPDMKMSGSSSSTKNIKKRPCIVGKTGQDKGESAGNANKELRTSQIYSRIRRYRKAEVGKIKENKKITISKAVQVQDDDELCAWEHLQ